MLTVVLFVFGFIFIACIVFLFLWWLDLDAMARQIEDDRVQQQNYRSQGFIVHLDRRD